MPLANASVDLEVYIYNYLAEGVEINALGIYLGYHSRALVKISKLNSHIFSQEDRSAIIKSAFADEAFALHFLRDAFTAGYVAGTRGDESQRKGTHDYYNEFGLKVITWCSESIVLSGDPWMRDEDCQRDATAIRISLGIFLDAASNKSSYYLPAEEYTLNSPEDFDISTHNFMPPLKTGSDFISSLHTLVMKTSIPGLSLGLGEFPRFRAELG